MKDNTLLWVIGGMIAVLLLKPDLLKNMTSEASRILPAPEAP